MEGVNEVTHKKYFLYFRVFTSHQAKNISSSLLYVTLMKRNLANDQQN
jgi:hypothetical protein